MMAQAAVTAQGASPRSAAASSAQVFDPDLPQLRRVGDLYMLGAAVLHAVLLAGVGMAYGQETSALAVAALLGSAAGACFLWLRGRWANSVLLPLILAAFVAAEIHFGLGKTEFHFGVFVTLSFLLVYRHWLPILVGAGAFAVHHLGFDRLQAMGFPVFCLTEPSFWDVMLHAGYVVAQAGVGVAMAHRMRQEARLMGELEGLTAGLSARGRGSVDFAALGLPVATGSAQRLQGALGHVRGAVALVRSSVDQVAAAARELASGNLDLSRRTEDAAAGLQSSASALHVYSHELGGSVDGIRQMADRARHSQQAAQEVARSAHELDQRMKSITASAVRIKDITSTIDTIAFQTNILALNAAVESARAGESGRGFAVVATEVRLLAQRSATAAREVRVLIDDSVREIQAGAAVASSTHATLSEIDALARQVADYAGTLSTTLASQARGIAEVSGTIGDLDRHTQHNAALVEQTAATAESLRHQSQRLETALRGFHGMSAHALV